MMHGSKVIKCMMLRGFSANLKITGINDKNAAAGKNTIWAKSGYTTVLKRGGAAGSSPMGL